MLYNRYNLTTVTSEDIAFEFTHNIENANEKYLNKKIRIIGEVKAIYKIMNTRLVIEFTVPSEELPIICFFENKGDEFEAQKLRELDIVTVTGVCLGTSAYSYIRGIKFSVESMSKE